MNKKKSVDGEAQTHANVGGADIMVEKAAIFRPGHVGNGEIVVHQKQQ